MSEPVEHNHVDEPPEETESLDAELQKLIKRFHRIRWISLVAVIVVIAAGFAYLASSVIHQQNQLRGACALYKDLGALPVKPAPPVKRPSIIGVTIVIDSRIAFREQGCGRPPKADPSLVFWAHYYHLPLDRVRQH